MSKETKQHSTDFSARKQSRGVFQHHLTGREKGWGPDGALCQERHSRDFFGRCPIGKHQDPTSPAKFFHKATPNAACSPSHLPSQKYVCSPCETWRDRAHSHGDPTLPNNGHRSFPAQTTPLDAGSGWAGGEGGLALLIHHCIPKNGSKEGPLSSPKANTDHLVWLHCPVLPETTTISFNEPLLTLEGTCPYVGTSAGQSSTQQHTCPQLIQPRLFNYYNIARANRCQIWTDTI